MRGLPGRLLLPAVFIMVTLLLTGCGSRPYFVKRDMGIKVTIDWIKVTSWHERPDIYIELTLGNSQVVRLPGPATAWDSWPIGGQYSPPGNNVVTWDVSENLFDYQLVIEVWDKDHVDLPDDFMASSTLPRVKYTDPKQSYVQAWPNNINPYITFQYTVEPVVLYGGYSAASHGDIPVLYSITSGDTLDSSIEFGTGDDE